MIDPGSHYLAGLGQQEAPLAVSHLVVSDDGQQPDLPGLQASGGSALWLITFIATTDKAATRIRMEMYIVHLGFFFGGQQFPSSQPQSLFSVDIF